MIIDTEKYWDAATTATLLGVTPRRVSALIKTQRLGETVLIGHSRLIPKEAVQNFKRLSPGVKKKPNSKEIMMNMLQKFQVKPKASTQTVDNQEQAES